MKPKTLFIILLVSGVCQNLFSQIAPEDYSNGKMVELMKKYIKIEGEFVYSLIPIPAEYLIAQSYPQWKEKRYDEKMMVSLSKGIITMYGNDFHAMLMIGFTGDWKSDKDKKIPKDFAEYIFLENTNGEFTRCRKADIPMYSTINIVNKNASIHLVFPTELPDTSRLVTDGMDKIFVVVGGIGIKNNKFEFDMPISLLYLDAPKVLKDLYYNCGLWDEKFLQWKTKMDSLEILTLLGLEPVKIKLYKLEMIDNKRSNIIVKITNQSGKNIKNAYLWYKIIGYDGKVLSNDKIFIIKKEEWGLRNNRTEFYEYPVNVKSTDIDTVELYYANIEYY